MIKGCDSGAPVSNYMPRLAALGYEAVGRYYVMTNSARDWRFFSEAERDIILRNGARIISIWQHKGSRVEFTRENGKRHAVAAINNAMRLGQPQWTKIYAAVDFDATPADIRDRVIPYMRAFRDVLAGAGYHAGVYGSGAVLLACKAASVSSAEFLACSPAWRNHKEGTTEAEIVQSKPIKPFSPDQFEIDPLSITDLERAGAWTI